MDGEHVRDCLRLLRQAQELPLDDAERRLLEQAASDFVRDSRRRRRAQVRAERRAADAKIIAATATGAPDRIMDAALTCGAPPGQRLSVHEYVQLQSDSDPRTQPPRNTPAKTRPLKHLNRPQRCYVCKNHYRQVHHFYHQLCPPCAEENFAYRTARTDLTGRRALLTGGRVKIGHQAALMLLRDGAELTVTSRFPRDTERRFAAAPDAADWWSRLRIAALDLRDPRQIIAFTDDLLGQDLPLDILINNAAQTLRRSPHAYAALAAAETRRTSSALPTAHTWTAPGFSTPGTRTATLPWVAELTSQPAAPVAAAAPECAAMTPTRVAHMQQITDEAGLLTETTASNSWTLQLGQVDPVELLEVQLINVIAPFLLADRLLPLLSASSHPHRYVINVSAVEGQFTVRNKTSDHPHTNMAKAALNMMTRTSAHSLAPCGIYTCSVDTGWVTDEKPLPARERHASSGWRPPLDIIDGAARVYHPIVQGESGQPVHGVLLKDYKSVPW
ncbi:SDR family NAD(P)-dependent oxidoreductase [Streptomyces sp. NPDC004787]|uniref:SDR family NAD(P)-dependent oxidoreductase n=1 Tax=Streptomyces sp. NPDC004787 TaxID=3154291 RepID=UPI0033BA356B